jgi:hypothetical protein
MSQRNKNLRLKNFPTDWIRLSYYSMFWSKIIFSEVRLRRKIAFNQPGKFWTYTQKNKLYLTIFIMRLKKIPLIVVHHL